MQTLICSTPHHLEYTNTPTPVASAGETLLKIKRIGICGTDLHAYEGTIKYSRIPPSLCTPHTLIVAQQLGFFILQAIHFPQLK